MKLDTGGSTLESRWLQDHPGLKKKKIIIIYKILKKFMIFLP